MSAQKENMNATPSELAKSRVRLWLKILRVSRYVENQLKEKLKTEFNSTLPRFDVLAALGRFEDGLKMNELSDVLRVSNGNVTGIIDRLVEGEFVVRMSLPGDRRASIVKLTDLGKAEFKKRALAHEQWIDQMFGSIEEEDLSVLSERFDLMIKSASDDKNKK